MYDWYKLFNLTEWLATGLVQRSLKIDLEALGEKTFLVTQGNTTAVLFEDKFLPVEFLGQNPYVIEDVAIYKNGADDVFIGFEVEE